MRAVILVAVASVVVGCATATEDASNVGTKKDSGHADIGAAADETGTTTDAGGESTIDEDAPADTAESTDTGESTDSTTPDTGTPDTGTPDTGTPDTGTPDTGTPPDTGGVGATFIFPQTGDTRFTASGSYFWNAGDYYSGSRSTTLSSATSFSTGMAIDNVLSCDSIQMQVRINGTLVGTKTISSGPVSIPISFTFGAITGPSYTIEYKCALTVASGCGSIMITDDVSSVTLK
ncbi:MAG: hypothetical protein ACXVEF_00455 [Polyangiales bacterium]